MSLPSWGVREISNWSREGSPSLPGRTRKAESKTGACSRKRLEHAILFAASQSQDALAAESPQWVHYHLFSGRNCRQSAETTTYRKSRRSNIRVLVGLMSGARNMRHPYPPLI